MRHKKQRNREKLHCALRSRLSGRIVSIESNHTDEMTARFGAINFENGKGKLCNVVPAAGDPNGRICLISEERCGSANRRQLRKRANNRTKESLELC